MTLKIRLYFSDKIQSDLVSHLTKEQSHYVKDVMRLEKGGYLSVFNAQGEWNAIIENYEKEGARIKILKKVRDRDNEKNIWLAFSPIKQNPLNFIIQKGTELGVQKFIPIGIRIDPVRWFQLIHVKQCSTNKIGYPCICTKTMYLSKFPKNGCLLFCDINCEKNNLKNILSKKIEEPICVLIGPEGDFSETERKLIIGLKQTHSISLAKNILRAETAALSAITIVSYHLNLS